MDFLDLFAGLALSVAIPGVPLLGVAAAALALISAQGRARAAAAALTAIAVIAFGTFWWAWGVGFDAADAYREVPGWVPGVEVGSLVTAGIAWLGLVAIAVAARGRRQPAPIGAAA